MKKLLCFLLTFCLLFSLAGCFKRAPEQPQTSETVNPNTGMSKPTGTTNPTGTNVPVDSDNTMVAVSVPTTTERVSASNGTLLFEYSYQSLSLVLHKPAVAEKIIIDFLNRVDSSRTSAQSVAEEAKSMFGTVPNWVAYRYYLTYNPTRIDHRVLSLSGSNEIYNGGSHPNRTCVSANYDLTTGDVLTLASIMTPQAKVDDFCNLVLEGLAGRAEGDYLYEDYAKTVKQRFTADITQDQDWFFSTTGLCFSFAPYEIAPYTSGIITVEIPYEKLHGLLYKDYFPARRDATTGSIKIASFTEVDLKNFSDIAELIENKNGKMYMLYPEGEVQNIKIVLNGRMIFAAYKLGVGEGIMIQTNEDSLKDMQLTYISNGQIVTANIK